MDANGATRCLARLCQLTSSELFVSLWPVVLRIARLVHQFTSQTASPKELFEFETQLQRLLCEVSRRIVEWKLNLLESRNRHDLPRSLLHQREARPRQSCYRCIFSSSVFCLRFGVCERGLPL